MEQTQVTGEALFPTQVQAAALLAAGHSLDQVCQALSVGRSTLYRWRQTPDFAAYLHQLLRTHADESLCQSAQLLSLATAKIKAVLQDPKTPPALQMRIAFKILGLYSRPSYLMMLQSLPDTADDVIRADFRRTQGKEEREMTTEPLKALPEPDLHR
ncbi:MAG TPA: phBC6A51 family helix-turn-helix protein, partial [Chloroflexota bacterium]|nr:phBC6A51 family helix-turn-helix protein [Chloroflexota bacterium]